MYKIVREKWESRLCTSPLYTFMRNSLLYKFFNWMFVNTANIFVRLSINLHICFYIFFKYFNIKTLILYTEKFIWMSFTQIRKVRAIWPTSSIYSLVDLSSASIFSSQPLSTDNELWKTYNRKIEIKTF